MLFLFAQDAETYDPSVGFPHPFYFSPFHLLFGPAFGLLTLAYMVFMIWMLVECVRKDPDRYVWMWLILVFHPFGSIIYFLVRWLPSNEFRAPKFLRKWFKSKELHRLESAAVQIGNPYHHIQLGDALRDAGSLERAGQSYDKALAKEPENLQALWGASLVNIEFKQFETALSRLQKLLQLDPQYKFGDVSLAYGRVLCSMSRQDEARVHFEKHVKRWRHPEGVYLLATICAQQGSSAEARGHLQAMLLDINGSPKAIARQQGMWKSKARRLLRKLPS